MTLSAVELLPAFVRDEWREKGRPLKALTVTPDGQAGTIVPLNKAVQRPANDLQGLLLRLLKIAVHEPAKAAEESLYLASGVTPEHRRVWATLIASLRLHPSELKRRLYGLTGLAVDRRERSGDLEGDVVSALVSEAEIALVEALHWGWARDKDGRFWLADRPLVSFEVASIGGTRKGAVWALATSPRTMFVMSSDERTSLRHLGLPVCEKVRRYNEAAAAGAEGLLFARDLKAAREGWPNWPGYFPRKFESLIRIQEGEAFPPPGRPRGRLPEPLCRN
jgi:hypothetical protein